MAHRYIATERPELFEPHLLYKGAFILHIPAIQEQWNGRIIAQKLFWNGFTILMKPPQGLEYSLDRLIGILVHFVKPQTTGMTLCKHHNVGLLFSSKEDAAPTAAFLS